MKPPEAGPASEPETSSPVTAGGHADAYGPAPRDSRLTRAAMLLPVIGAPAGLMFAILASLAISGWRVQHSAIVQVDPEWRPGDRVALRVHVQTGDGVGIPDAEVSASLVRDGQSVALAELKDVTGGGAAQGSLIAPDWAAGAAELQLDIRAGKEQFRERVPVTLTSTRAVRRGTVTVSGSIKNWADDTEPQPEKLRITMRALGRLAAGFDNTLLVRVTDVQGKPYVGEIEVRLIDGEFGTQKAVSGAPPVIVRGPTDGQGLLRFDGQLSTDVVRFEVRVPEPPPPVSPEGCAKCEADTAKSGRKPAKGGTKSGDAKSDAKSGDAKADAKSGDTKADAKSGDAKSGDAKIDAKSGDAKSGDAKPGEAKADVKSGDAKTGDATAATPDATAPAEPALLGARKVRMVSFAGAVRVTGEPLALRAGAPLTIAARALRAKKPVFIDLHGPDGAWVDTLAPVTGPEPPREWSTDGLAPGFVQIEAYQFTTAPGESAALARVQITEGEPDTDAALTPLFAQQRALLAVGRVEKGFDRELEGKYLDITEKRVIPAAEVPLARAWLLGTLPIEVLGPPLTLSTLPREQADLALRKQTWANGLRWFLLGGGGVFLLVTLVLIVLSHRRAAARLSGEIHGEGETATIAREIAEAQRSVLLRAVALVVTMACALVLTVVVLDKLLWSA